MSSSRLSLWKINERTGSYEHVRGVTPETATDWLRIFQRDEPNAIFVIAEKKPSTAVEKELRRMAKERLKKAGSSRDEGRTEISRAGQEWVSKKIRILREEGYPPRQAAAIAYSMYRRHRSTRRR